MKDASVDFREFQPLDPVARAAATAPLDHEPVTAEDHQRILALRAAISRGERGVPMEHVLEEFGLTMEDFPRGSLR